MANGEMMPDIRVYSMTWRPVHLQSSAQGRDTDQVNVYGDSKWAFDLKTRILTPAEFALWESFIARRQGERYTMLAPRRGRRAPQAGGVSSDSGLTITGYDRAAKTVDLANAGTYTATPGDMFSYYTANLGYYIGQVEADATASGGDITLTLNIPPVAPHATLAAPRRLDALGEFKLTDYQPNEEVGALQIAFSALQVRR